MGNLIKTLGALSVHKEFSILYFRCSQFPFYLLLQNPTTPLSVGSMQVCNEHKCSYSHGSLGLLEARL